MITAYTHPYRQIVDRIIVNCYVSIPDTSGQERYVKALWDTGATTTCISKEVAKSFGLTKIDERSVIGADNIPFSVDVYCIAIRMGRFVIPFLEVLGLPMEGNEHEMIIGMDVMSRGDLSITNYGGQTVLTFREPSLEKIDYVEELNLRNKCARMHSFNVARHLPDKCACGSGKDYKNCHGKSIYNK